MKWPYLAEHRDAAPDLSFSAEPVASHLSFRAKSKNLWMILRSVNRLSRMIAQRTVFLASILVLLTSSLLATSNYEYGPDEYVAVGAGISPDGKFAITAHGGGDMGYDNFHLYLHDALTGKKLGPLEEVKETLDTGADAFAAKWSRDSQEVTIVYRVDRHAPLKAVSYRIVGRRARLIKGPFEVKSEDLIRYWQNYGSHSSPSRKIFGIPLKHH